MTTQKKVNFLVLTLFHLNGVFWDPQRWIYRLFLNRLDVDVNIPRILQLHDGCSEKYCYGTNTPRM